MELLLRLSTRERDTVPSWMKAGYHRCIEELKVPWSYYEGNCTLIMDTESVAQKASRMVPRFYPPDVLDKLYDKSTVSAYLGEHGFNVLPARVVHTIEDIGPASDFILKPVHGQGSIYAKIGGFAYHKFSSVSALLLKFPNAHKQLAHGYVLQRAFMSKVTDEVILRGTVNSEGAVYWCRTSLVRRTGGKIIDVNRGWGGYDADRALIEAFVKKVGILNANFMLVLLLSAGALYPIDWNFRLGTLYAKNAFEVDYNEVKRALAHQFDVATDLPDTFPGNWKCAGDWTDGFTAVEVT